MITRRFLFCMICLASPHPAFAQNTGHSTEAQDVRIQLKPAQETKINAPMSGQVTKVYYKDGERIEKNATLITFECNRQKAQRAQAHARMNRQSKLLNAKQKLFNLGSASKTELGVLRAELAEAKAKHDLAKTQIKDCTIKAPFSGIVSALYVKDHYSTQTGDPMIELVGDGNLEIEMIVPSKWMRWLGADTPFSIDIDETGGHYSAKILRLGGRVDPITQSVKAYAVLDQDTPELLAGMSGQAHFPQMQKENKTIANIAAPLSQDTPNSTPEHNITPAAGQ